MSLLKWPRFPKRKTDPAAATLSSETTGAAIEILKTARVMWVRNKYPVEWGSPDILHRAFALYNLHHLSARQRPECAPCHIKVFNWLMDEAFKDVTVTQL